jgi:putative CocE/NonD family hydrolase
VVFEFLQKYLVPGAPVPERPRARVYLQGANRWVDSADWPPPSAEPQTLYLSPAGLEPKRPRAKTQQSYTTNPGAGASMAFDQYGTVAASPYVPTDQRAAGQDGPTWRTAPLAKPMTLTGSGDLHLVASSSADNTDWIAKLSDVAPDGSETIITAGFLRASYRKLDRARSTPQLPWHTDTAPTPIEPNRVYEYDIAIWPTAYQLPPGHRLQLRLTSSDFPTHLPGTLVASLDDPASTSFTPLPRATNTIRQGGRGGSWLRLTTG